MIHYLQYVLMYLITYVTEDLYGVAAGFYQVTVIDDNGCEVVVEETIQNVSTASVNNIESVNINVFK